MPAKEKEGISAVLIVYNEEKLIERCLKSLEGVVDEIIVIHDGECKDNTVSIASKYTDRVFIESHTGFCELHMIKALDYTSYSWILKLDADEFLSEEVRGNLRGLIEDEKYDAFAFIWPIWQGSSYISKNHPFKDTLFRKKNICMEEFPHRMYSTNGKKKNIPLLLEHRPQYNNYTLEAFKNKWIKWVKLQAFWTCQHQHTRFYNYSPEQIKAFHNKLEKQIRYSHPMLAPAWFILSFTKFFVNLKIWNDFRLFSVAFFQGLYAAYLSYYIWQIKKDHNSGQ